MVEAENHWRADNCPEYGKVYCVVPPICECAGSKNCPDINNEFYEIMTTLDVNGDRKLDLGDNIDPSYLTAL